MVFGEGNTVMKDRAILHSDLNCFFASVETVLNPEYRGKAIAVCGSTEERHGIVLAKSEKAKRAGVKTGMVNRDALALCPELIIVPPQYEYYLKFSNLVREIYYRYTDLIEPFGMDECWLDVTGSISLFGSAEQIAEEIRSAVKRELGLTVSIGVSFNKVFAKLGSDMKKPDAITVITRENFRDKVWPLPVGELLYAGRSTVARLNRMGVFTIGELAAISPEIIKSSLGKNGLSLISFARGEDSSRVMKCDFVSPVKSIGHGITCVSELKSEQEVWKVFLSLAQDIGHKLRLHAVRAAGIQITVKGEDLTYRQYQCPLHFPTQSPSAIARTALRLFRSNYTWAQTVRSLTVRAINLVPYNTACQLDVFTDGAKIIRREKLDDTVDSIRMRFGKSAITAAVLLGDLKIPGETRVNTVMPKLMYR